MREVDPLITGYSHLRDQPREAEALRALQKIASLVKPVMRQRGWRVGTLAEFYPNERNLLGVNWNRGQKICLRLRYPSDITQFLPMEQVVDTMLHELSHIVHDAHDQHFHALWQQLRDEHEQLTRKGYTGEGFLSEGRKLGGRRIPMDEARRRARAAAEKRQALNAGSGRKLGGAVVARGTDMRRVIADAVQRRLTVTEGCASGTKDSKDLADQATRNGFRTQAEEDDANERAIMQAYIELLQEEEKEKWGQNYVPPSQENPGGMSETRDARGPSSSRGPGADNPRTADLYERGGESSTLPSGPRDGPSVPPDHYSISSSSGASTPDSVQSASVEATRPGRDTLNESQPTSADLSPFWTCPTCTLHNAALHLCCSACGMERPPEVSGTIDHTPIPPRPETDSPRSSRDRTNQRATTRPQAPRVVAPLRSVPQTTARISKGPVPGWWACHNCGQNMEEMWWTCDQCGIMKQES